MWFPVEFSCKLYNSCSSLDISPMRFIVCATIGHWSSGCHNKFIHVKNVNETFNKKGLIKNTIEVDIFYKEYKERTEIDMIEGQK